KVPLNEDGSLVRLVDARVAYTDNIVFKDLNWTIRPGEHWQVKGPNGSGKTCLLELVTGDHPQCYVNDLRLFGHKRGQGETIWQLKRHMGFVSTSLHWDYRLSVGVRNVIVSGFYDSIGLYQKATDRQLEIADSWLTMLGLQRKATVSFSSLSYGEQRVLLIARAMVKHPPLLLLDEPCLGLDDANRQLVLALTERICDEGNTTLVYVTHHQEDRIRNISNELVLG
ncbi:MAG TPA: ATP-binding cassette domain-containing protein, partial [Pseudomonadales bacterium]|nr:ATP-binding cassette domain-containing protein [Pseudomonadales bacterium]